jgi:hypothetical protein
MDDSISRQAAIDVLKGLPTWWADEGGYYGGAQPPMVALLDPEDAVSAIENLSSAQPEQRWIPCSERLPENGRQVLVYAMSTHFALAKYDEMLEADGSYKKQWVTFDAWKPFYTVKNVIAWMPLPEPYRAERRTSSE